jgi:hypothetical protein
VSAVLEKTKFFLFKEVMSVGAVLARQVCSEVLVRRCRLGGYLYSLLALAICYVSSELSLSQERLCSS